MKIFASLLIFIFIFIMLDNSTHAQNYESAIQKTDGLMKELLLVANLPAMSVAVSIEDSIVYSGSFGYSDIELKTVPNESTKFRTGSINKLFTALATAKLIDDEVIRGDDPVNKYVKNLPEAYRNITIQQLASHTSGIRHYSRDEVMSSNTLEYPDLEAGLTKFINDSLLFLPGEKYYYSSYGYILLGAVLEKACNKKFNDIISDLVLTPSGMTETFPELSGHPRSNTSEFYYRTKEQGFVLADGENYSYKWPAGGYLSTSSDLAKFGSYILDEKLVNANIRSLLFTTEKTNDGLDINCGYGFRIGTDNEGRKVVHHGGESDGGRAFMLIYPEQKLTVALFSNVFRAPLFEGEAETIAGYFLNEYSLNNNLVKSKINFSTMYNDKETDIIIDVDNMLISGMSQSNMPVYDIVSERSKIRIISISPSGIINFWLSKDGESYLGSWGYDKEETKLVFK